MLTELLASALDQEAANENFLVVKVLKVAASARLSLFTRFMFARRLFAIFPELPIAVTIPTNSKFQGASVTVAAVFKTVCMTGEIEGASPQPTSKVKRSVPFTVE